MSKNSLGVEKNWDIIAKNYEMFDHEYLWNSGRASLLDDKRRNVIWVRGRFPNMSLVGLSNRPGIRISFSFQNPKIEPIAMSGFAFQLRARE
jgi:hypothetical protein